MRSHFEGTQAKKEDEMIPEQSSRSTSVFNLKKSWEFIEFYKWCENNNRLPMKLIKKYCRYTVLQDRELE